MRIVERAHGVEDREQVEYYSTEGLKALGDVTSASEPGEIVKAIGEHVDAQRAQVKDLDEDDYALFILSMGYLWGDQVCRRYGWHWASVGDGESMGDAVVSADRAFFIYPLQFIKRFVDDIDRPTTTILLFNMLEPRVLADQLPHAQPGGYQLLG